ncbi:archaetidylserine decarboxylase [Neolewinella antarctica]|uniref:phosphatidylserine decarboxylase n=1 Tax=Neolewinella antarctica TaxID=442734 RepID=A0ABX0XEM9_9BACT|nr:archaetidylserine decarboxylase [Neolewinella antarctica]NJC27351.1 phosphatidylserine decarboxylase [Neolewinella antarctica]
MSIQYVNRYTGKMVTEHPPAEEVLNFLYHNPFGEKLLLPVVKQEFISKWYGKMMDSSSSVKRIQPFIDSLGIDMTDSRRNVGEFKTFNDFFSRKLKPGAREIKQGLVSPGDGKMLAFKKVSQVNSFYVKGKKFTLTQFLGSDELAEQYNGCSMVILRLAPEDYHRYHFPYGGTPSESKEIDGDYLSVSPISLDKHFTKVFTDNKKEICKLTTEQNGEILIIPVGATMVGSLTSTYEANKNIEKGQEMGYFSFGGSSVVLLFDADYFELDEDLVRNTQNELETSIKMGDRVATAK